MGAQYSITTRVAGEVITATNYNADHQNHVDNGDAGHLGGEATNAGALQTTQDPYPAQAATDTGAAYVIQRDVRHLRYIVGQLANFLNGGAGIAAAATALGTTLPQWYYGIRNPALKTVGVKVYKSTTFSHTTSGTRQAVSWATGDFTEDYDADGAGTGFHEGATNPTRLTIPANAGGKYHIGGNASFAASATGTLREVSIRKNGATFLATTITSWAMNAARSVNLTVSCDAQLVAGDYLELIINQDIATPSNVGGVDNVNGPVMWCHLIGA